MLAFRQASLSIALLLLLGPSVDGQAPVDLTNDSRRRIDEIITTEQQRLKIPGIGVAIALNGRLEYVKSAGLADIENEIAVDDASRFRTASLAKPLTATAVMQLVERARSTSTRRFSATVPRSQRSRGRSRRASFWAIWPASGTTASGANQPARSITSQSPNRSRSSRMIPCCTNLARNTSTRRSASRCSGAPSKAHRRRPSPTTCRRTCFNAQG